MVMKDKYLYTILLYVLNRLEIIDKHSANFLLQMAFKLH